MAPDRLRRRVPRAVPGFPSGAPPPLRGLGQDGDERTGVTMIRSMTSAISSSLHSLPHTFDRDIIIAGMTSRTRASGASGQHLSAPDPELQEASKELFQGSFKGATTPVSISARRRTATPSSHS
ncbi:hypothetical protein SNE510_56330 [Streptomyces sp. NE5-10]|nr:hypothetical protein SNE510_56330 [Streptomyces sp. NE5-10]